MADAMVNSAEWENLSAETQSQISSFISQTFGGSVIPSGNGLTASDAQNYATAASTGTSCTDDCNTAQAACTALCAVTGPDAPFCIAACIAAGWTCRQFC